MRCPKCSYLSYDDVERCRNCGYDFSLATTHREPAPPVPVDPTREPRAWEPTRRRRSAAMDTPFPAEGGPLDLPLFEDAPVPEPPPVAIPPAGPPLSVRRTIDIARPPTRVAPARVEPVRAEPARAESPLEAADVPQASAGFDWPDEATAPAMPGPELPAIPPDPEAPADAVGEGLTARLRAGAVDALVLGGIDALVLWLTLQVAGVALAEWRLLPLMPILGFLFLLDTAYLVTFTAASGQTIGKMLTGLRVVYGERGRVPFGHAVLRSVALLLCAMPAGLGVLPVFMDPERRGAHDRLAGTRVVPVEQEPPS